jgi:NifB/MoaA-like Fe-S oxidoreductase
LGAATDVPLRCYRPDEAAKVIDLLLPYASRYQQEVGTPLVYPSDEFYLLCGRELPPADFYGGYPQYSNGVGMTRDFLDEWARAQRRLPAALPRPTRLALLCGTLIAPTLERLAVRLSRIRGLEASIVPVQNQFFGEMVTVSGLLMGQDVVPVLRELAAQGFGRALLPRVMFDHTAERTLDEYSLDRISAESGVAVALAGSPDEVVRYARALSRSE